ncbi:MAG: TetR/AcrR family transcriptional regulator [Hamadaea sp.]|nr:TetR/AcrR family transcriptional regulator [Hamadaea sp.]NUR50623.1 TetR/AcrR family transcriptional regulator [Hamadaea sp.]NUT05918.1 TetR/AcrR family transcriptional regulator [Hamadaea sp.]
MAPATSGTRAAGRPTRMPRSARRSQLLAAAQDVFVAQGYHAAAMDDIAERAGVSKPVLYQHFPGKLELYLALLDTHCDAIIAKIRSAMEATTDNAERVRGATHAYFDFVSHESEAFRLVFESDLRNDPAVRERVERVEQASVEAITATIMADTAVDRARAEILAAGLTGISQVAARYWLTGGREIAQEEAERLISALSWRGIASFPLSGDHAGDHADDHGGEEAA